MRWFSSMCCSTSEIFPLHSSPDRGKVGELEPAPTGWGPCAWGMGGGGGGGGERERGYGIKMRIRGGILSMDQTKCTELVYTLPSGFHTEGVGGIEGTGIVPPPPPRIWKSKFFGILGSSLVANSHFQPFWSPRSNLRECKFQKRPGGAYPPHPLGGMTLHTSFSPLPPPQKFCVRPILLYLAQWCEMMGRSGMKALALIRALLQWYRSIVNTHPCLLQVSMTCS